MCEVLGLIPDAVLYVGDDDELDVVAARAAGLTAVHLARLSDDRQSTEEAISFLTELLDLLERRPA